MAEQLLHVVARDRPRVVAEIANVLAHRQVPLVSLNTGRMEPGGLQRIHLVIDVPGAAVLERVQKWLNRIVDVLKVVPLTEEMIHARTAIIVKVSAGPHDRGAICDLGRALQAEIVELAPEVVTLAYCSTADNVASLLALLAPYGVLESVALGTTAVLRGERTLYRPLRSAVA